MGRGGKFDNASKSGHVKPFPNSLNRPSYNPHYSCPTSASVNNRSPAPRAVTGNADSFPFNAFATQLTCVSHQHKRATSTCPPRDRAFFAGRIGKPPGPKSPPPPQALPPHNPPGPRGRMFVPSGVQTGRGRGRMALVRWSAPEPGAVLSTFTLESGDDSCRSTPDPAGTVKRQHNA